MKKLMIAAAAAAMVGGASAEDIPQVYDFTATVKATECAGKTAKDVCGNEINYRIQKTKKVYGKFWGCECGVILPGCSSKFGAYGVDAADENSFIFWTNTKDEEHGAFHDATFDWSPLNVVGKKGENVEGFFTLTLFSCEDGQVLTDPSAVLYGAGYGTAKINCTNPEDSYIKSMSGNIVGTWDPGDATVGSGCVYCGTSTQCEVSEFCTSDCGDTLADNDTAVAFGSFTLKYNASQSKALKTGNKKISTVAFKSNKAVLKQMECIAKGAVTPEESTVKKLEKAYAEAKTAYETATNELAAAEELIDEKTGRLILAKSADYIAITNALATTKDAADKSEKAKDTAAGKIPSAVKTPFGNYVTAKVNLLQAEQVYAQLNKYAKAADVKTFKEGALKTAQDALDGDDTSKDVYGIYTNAVAGATIGGSDAADNKKAIEAAEKALTDYLDDLKDLYEAEAAADVWDGKYFSTTAEIQAFVNKGDGTYTASGKSLGSSDELKKIEGTYEYAEAEAKADIEAKDDAADAAEKKMDNAKIACDVAGGDCK